jgi:hypothetical protein
VLELLDELDSHGFASGNGTLGARSFARRVADCYAVVDEQAVPESHRTTRRFRFGSGDNAGFGKLLLLASLCMPVTGLLAQPAITTQDTSGMVGVTMTAPAQQAGESRRDALNAYERRQFADAQERFAGLVRSNPTDADLLVNWGTAAWAAGDTVHAVIAWQRAARLYPLAGDIQQRLALLPPGARGGVADVPMMPVPLLRWSAIALWVAGWTFAAWLALRGPDQRHRATALLRGAMWAALGGAVAVGGASLWGQRALNPSSLSVVLQAETMFVAPGTDAEAMGGVTTGDVVQRLESLGSWQRVHHADGREGWLPSLRLAALSSGEDGVAVPSASPSFEPALTPVR